MALNIESELRNVTGISSDEKQRIADFLQGSVYCWCKNRKDEWFSLREFMGGENYYWQGTPMLPLYLKHKSKSSDPVKAAGKDGGWLLKYVIVNDKRLFETRKKELIRQYRWILEDEKST
ncbi:MAG: cell division protein SepF [Methylococcales symbiont of Hymedesmia sp. n. MRB-2018]|nr:MAG: cell division protein SepF [Methylococcales symbiont of Hymedesmia sp. n. MRB-2018]